MHTSYSPELLCPAGTLKAMRYAFAYGADAVYAGQPRYSLRVVTMSSITRTSPSASPRPIPRASVFMWW